MGLSLEKAIVLGLLSLAASGCDKGDPAKPTATSAPSTRPRPAASVASSRYKAREVTNGKSLSVRVDFTGKRRPTPWPLAESFKEHCNTTSAPDESLAVAEGGGLEGAVVWLDDITEGARITPATVVQDQKGCVFTPHVLAVAAGSTLRLTNSDPAVHQVRFNLGDIDSLTRTIAPGGTTNLPVKPEWAGHLANITCPIHLWMWSYAQVFDHPYFAVTKAGAAKIENIPPGSYHLTVWHEGLGPTYKNELTLTPPAIARVAVTIDKDDLKLAFTMDDSGKIAPP